MGLSFAALWSMAWVGSASAGYKIPADAKVLQEMKKEVPDGQWDKVDKLTWGKWYEEWRNTNKALGQPADILARDVDIIYKKDPRGNTAHVTSKVRYSILGGNLQFREHTPLGVDYLTRQALPDKDAIATMVVEHLKTKKMYELIPDNTVRRYKEFTRGAISIKKIVLIEAALDKSADNVISVGRETGTFSAKMNAVFDYAIRDATTVKTQKIVEVTLPFLATFAVDEASGNWVCGSVTRFEKGDFSAIYPSGTDRMKEEYLPLEFMTKFADGYQKRTVATGDALRMVEVNYTDRDLTSDEGREVKRYLYNVRDE